MEFVQTRYSPRGVILLYFQGDALTEVDKHFNRTLSELCCLLESAENSMEGSRLQGAFTGKCNLDFLQFCILVRTRLF